MNWKIDNKQPVYSQIKSQFRSGVLTGQFPMGSRVPSVRELAAEISANPNTVQRAYAELEAEKLLVCSGTQGRFVTDDTAVIEKLRQDAIAEALRISKALFQAVGLEPKEAAALLLNDKEDA